MINERPSRSQSVSVARRNVASTLVQPSIPSAPSPPLTIPPPPPLPQYPPADHSVLELLQVFNQTGLLGRWKKYLNNSDLLTVSDVLPTTTYRLATWNLDRLTVAKAKHPGVREAICLTILSNQFDLVAFQEIVEPEAIQLVKIFNAP